VQTLDNLCWDPFFEEQLTETERAQLVPARVVWHGRGYRVATDKDERPAQVAGRMRQQANAGSEFPVVGDWVLVDAGGDVAIIRRLLTRRTQIVRAAAGRAAAAQTVCANVDTALLVTSCNQDFNLRRIERYLALAWESGANPIIVINKSDLAASAEDWRARMRTVAFDVPVLVTSAASGEGIDELRDLIRRGGTTVLLGSSGVGKSTLLNTVLDDVHQVALPIRDDGRGRHSTTARHLFQVSGGGVVIDTPGMRALQMWDAERGLQHAFSDIETLAEACRFRDCAHQDEPGCAILEAIESGDLAADRLEHFARLRREDAYMRSRHDEQATSERNRKWKQIAKSTRLLYKLRRR
jgi:ribosome biogenesis GTPase / thiamine phosphate phosphatase